MTTHNPNEPTPEQLEKHFSAMQDSVDLITSLQLKESLSKEEQDRLNRNKEHLSIMLDKDFIKSDSRDKKIFIDASK
jgi:hypothetical protein